MRDVGKGPGVHEDGRLLHSLHERGHDGVLHEHGGRAGHAEVLCGDRVACIGVGHHDAAQALSHVLQRGGERQNRHDLAGDRDVEARGARLAPALGGRLAHGDLAQVPVARVEHALPCDGRRVDVESHEARHLFFGELGRVRLVDAELGEPLPHWRQELAGAGLVCRAQTPKQSRVRLRLLVVHARVDGGRDEVVGRRHGVDVACEVEVELLHGHHL